MLCPLCDKEGVRYGKTRPGTQRFYCRACFYSFSEPEPIQRVYSDRQLTMDKAARAVSLLMEGVSIRSACRLVKIGQKTLLDFLLRLGQGCAEFQHNRIYQVYCTTVQCYEIWSWVFCKEKKRIKRGYSEEDRGECWTWTAICPVTKLLLAHAVGKRDNATAIEFVHKLRRATAGNFQINTDGLSLYRSVIPMAFGLDQAHAQLVKVLRRHARTIRFVTRRRR